MIPRQVLFIMQRFVIFLHKARSVTPDVAATLGVAGLVEEDEVCKPHAFSPNTKNLIGLWLEPRYLRITCCLFTDSHVVKVPRELLYLNIFSLIFSLLFFS